MRSASGTERPKSKDPSFSARHSSQQRNPARRKSRSLDSSPAPYERPLLGVRRSWAVQVRQMKNEKNSLKPRIASANEVTQGGAREKRFALARLSPLFGRKLLGGDTGAEPKRQKNSPRGSSEPNTPNGSPQLGRRRNPTKKERHNSPIRWATVWMLRGLKKFHSLRSVG
jgi:hypothetical protein